jgi:hypothetical protein
VNEEPETQNTKPETENMEVHHHPDLHHKRKNFREYFLEFLMIFLAVTMGFIAENLRETIKNKNEVQEDIRSLVNDLKADISYTDTILQRNEYSCNLVDTLIDLLHHNNSNTQQIYYVARAITANFGYFYTNSKTFDQMKSSGSLKLISHRNLLDSIGNYYSSFQSQNNQTELMRQKINEIHTGNAEVFDAYIFQQMMHINYGGGGITGGIAQILRPEGTPQLLTKDHNKINTVELHYHYFYATTKFYDSEATQLRDYAERLVQLITKEYHLENE